VARRSTRPLDHMAISARQFKQSIGAELVDALNGQYKFFKSRVELRADASDGHNVIVLAGATKYSPYISVDFYFGRNFASAKQIERRLGEHQFYYHIHQYSPNRKAMKGLDYSGPYTWSVDINNPPKTLVTELAGAIQGMAVPFFERFADIQTARDALAANDRWCLGGTTFWHQLLIIDLAINDLAHFERWSETLEGFDRKQASEMIRSFKKTSESV